LREALVVLHEGLLGHKLEVILHAHDEIVVECLDTPKAVAEVSAALAQAMTFPRHWTKCTFPLPLAVDITERWWYSAALKSPETHSELSHAS
jgi:DNA polymerase I-like protein with 3'-5' exonuclease and polymerase domains